MEYCCECSPFSVMEFLGESCYPVNGVYSVDYIYKCPNCGHKIRVFGVDEDGKKEA